MRARIALLLLAAVAAIAATLVYNGTVRIPDRWNPWAPLDIAEPPNFLTRYKLSRLDDDDALCRRTIAQAGFRYEWLPDRTTAPGCVVSNALRIDATSVSVGTPFPLSCRSAVSLALWERHVLQPQALAHFGVRVDRMRHYGSYVCRNIQGRDDGRRSQHATADALDIAAFVLANRREIRVLSNWAGDDADARFLRDVHAGACRFFDAVLGPDYNAAHRDHLHFDRGAYRACR
jgi:hypothetical protein